MNHPDFQQKYRISSQKSPDFLDKVEKKVIFHSKYIGSSSIKYREFIWNNINAEAIFTKTFIATVPNIPLIENKKKFDFVYFAASISKAADFAVEAFALVCKRHPELTLNIVGEMPNPFTQILKARIKELDIEHNVIFSGKLKTNDDVFKQVQLAKIALLPQKISNAPGTIREAMFCGLPVVTKATPDTIVLNEKRESVLLSEPDNHQAMANNMIKLIKSPDLARIIAENGLKTARERWNNKEIMLELIAAYRAIIDHHQNVIPIPDEIGAVNPNI
jgi:glycosyltransferase involved in cell wall biosynthesis